jgi:hypothetical protein
MKRLGDELSPMDPALRLLRAARPLEPSVELRLSVRRSLAATAPAARGRWLPRLVVAAVLLVAGMAAARAAVGRWWRAPERPAPASSQEHARTQAAPTGVAHPAPVAEGVAPAPVHHAKSRVARPVADAPAPIESVAPPSEPREGRLLLAGIRELRQLNHPERASALFKEYLESYPNGSFAEEVLALSIEAAASDGERARRLATEYLAKYPRGRFHSLATRTLQTERSDD